MEVLFWMNLSKRKVKRSLGNIIFVSAFVSVLYYLGVIGFVGIVAVINLILGVFHVNLARIFHSGGNVCRCRDDEEIYWKRCKS